MDELNKSDLLHNAAASAGVALGNADGMTPLEQAAILLLCMGEEPASAVLRCLSREELLAVTQEMSSLSGIKVDAVKTSIQKFFEWELQPSATAQAGSGRTVGRSTQHPSMRV